MATATATATSPSPLQPDRLPPVRLFRRAVWGGDVVGGFEVVEQGGDGRRSEGGAETDAGHAKGFREGLHDNEVGILGDELGKGSVFKANFRTAIAQQPARHIN